MGSPESAEVIADFVKTIVQSEFAGFIVKAGSDTSLLVFPILKSPAVETVDYIIGGRSGQPATVKVIVV